MKTQIVVGARTSDVWEFRFDRFYRISVILSEKNVVSVKRKRVGFLHRTALINKNFRIYEAFVKLTLT